MVWDRVDGPEHAQRLDERVLKSFVNGLLVDAKIEVERCFFGRKTALDEPARSVYSIIIYTSPVSIHHALPCDGVKSL